MKIKYLDKQFAEHSLELIRISNEIITEYQAQGLTVTLRQLYYQLVARNLIPNKNTEYKRLGNVLRDARNAGLVDWKAIVDRTRFLRRTPFWETPKDALDELADKYAEDYWTMQNVRPEVWVEKDALLDIVGIACNRYGVPYFSCRGYTSQTSVWSAAYYRMHKAQMHDQATLIIHLADHDPSGLDMTEDIRNRLELYSEDASFTVVRIALNMDQVEQYTPPPNPAKLKDSRAAKYIAEYGYYGWELDALKPDVVIALVDDAIKTCIHDQNAWDTMHIQIQAAQETLRNVSKKYFGEE